MITGMAPLMLRLILKRSQSMLYFHLLKLARPQLIVSFHLGGCFHQHLAQLLKEGGPFVSRCCGSVPRIASAPSNAEAKHQKYRCFLHTLHSKHVIRPIP